MMCDSSSGEDTAAHARVLAKSRMEENTEHAAQIWMVGELVAADRGCAAAQHTPESPDSEEVDDPSDCPSDMMRGLMAVSRALCFATGGPQPSGQSASFNWCLRVLICVRPIIAEWPLLTQL